MLLWIIAKLLIHFLFAIIWEMKNMLFYMLLFHIFKQWGVFKINESLIGGTAYVVNYPISNNKTWIVLSAFHSGFEYIKIISKVYSKWESSCEITTNETIESNKNTSIFLFIIGNN